MSTLTAKPVIYDGDMGGDDIWGIMMMLAYPEHFDVKGITTVFGNVDCEHATLNVLDILSHYNQGHIPVYRGASKPLQGECKFGDGAYGDDGIGGVVLKGAKELQARDGAVQFIIDTVESSPEPVTIFGTGPSTNIALALQARPEIAANIAAVMLMGGALRPGPTPNPPERIGNITLHSEFNFFQDPYAANVVFNSGVQVHVMTMDATQNIHLDPVKRDRILSITDFNLGAAATGMLAPAEALDRPKFGTDGPFIHDPNVVTYALNPAQYKADTAFVDIAERPDETGPLSMDMRHGAMSATWNRLSNVTVVHGMINPGRVFDAMEDALRKFAARTVALQP